MNGNYQQSENISYLVCHWLHYVQKISKLNIDSLKIELGYTWSCQLIRSQNTTMCNTWNHIWFDSKLIQTTNN